MFRPTKNHKLNKNPPNSQNGIDVYTLYVSPYQFFCEKLSVRPFLGTSVVNAISACIQQSVALEESCLFPLGISHSQSFTTKSNNMKIFTCSLYMFYLRKINLHSQKTSAHSRQSLKGMFALPRHHAGHQRSVSVIVTFQFFSLIFFLI